MRRQCASPRQLTLADLDLAALSRALRRLGIAIRRMLSGDGDIELLVAFLASMRGTMTPPAAWPASRIAEASLGFA